MKVRPMQLKYNNPGKQRGIATILVVVMVGLALTATSLGIMHSLRSTQEKHVAVHAATHAQTGVWTGVEIFRRYLGTITMEALVALDGTGTLAIQLDGGDISYGTLSVNNINVVAGAAAGSYQVSADIVNIHRSAGASSAVGAVYNITPGNSPTVILPAALNFLDDLVAAGQITFKTLDGQSPNINIKGNIKIMDASSTKLGRLNITGSATFGSGIIISHLHSNGDVNLSGSAWIDKIEAGGYVRTALSSGAGAGIIEANGYVTMEGYPSKASTSIKSLSNITLTGGNHALLNAKGTVSTNVGASGPISAEGDISISAWVTVGTITGEGNLTCPGVHWTNYTSASLNGVAVNCRLPPNSNPAPPTVGATNDVITMTPVPVVEVPPMMVDVWALKPWANYILEYDATKARTKVTVNNISGVPNNSVFWVGDYASGELSYLCTAFDGSGNGSKCTEPAVPGMALCLGNNDQCMAYDATTNTWTFTGSNLAPGIMWIGGSVFLNNNYNYTTFLVAEDVKTGGEFRGVAANYGGYDEMCLTKGLNAKVGSAKYQSIFSDQYPTNLCDKTKTDYLEIPVGNIAIAAGGYDPKVEPEVYSGGNIWLADNNIVFGTVLAGNLLTTAGQSVVHGYIAAAALEQVQLADNELGGSTTVDLTTKPATFDPALVPNMGQAPCVNDCVPGGNGAQSTLLWSRYL